MNPSSGAATPVGTITGFTYVQALDFDDATGTLYGWDQYSGLLTINPASGAGSDVNPSLAGPTMMSLVVLPNGAMVGGQQALYSIDKVTGEATQIGASTLNNVRGIEVLQ